MSYRQYSKYYCLFMSTLMPIKFILQHYRIIPNNFYDKGNQTDFQGKLARKYKHKTGSKGSQFFTVRHHSRWLELAAIGAGQRVRDLLPVFDNAGFNKLSPPASRLIKPQKNWHGLRFLSLMTFHGFLGRLTARVRTPSNSVAAVSRSYSGGSINDKFETSRKSCARSNKTI